ncbi:MAG: Gfo/Idh/MocA family oxidoreductase [Verrucomicrobiota bacterium]
MEHPIPRRDFVSTMALSGLALAAAPAVLSANSLPTKIKVALIGCGGRGTGALGQFIAACKILGIEPEVVALGDAFEDKVQKLGQVYKLPAPKLFSGYDAYQKVMATDCTFVLMATPPAFRPVHFAAAIDAGKHCFIEKPVAVDPVGARSIIATGEKAKAKGLAVVAGTQRRHAASYLKNKALIDAGAIGAIRGGIVQWNGTVPWLKRRGSGESDASYMNHNWLNFVELSGDHIVEQHIHNIDVANWFLGRTPVSALGFGGRARRETGNMFDFFSVDYDYGDAVHIHSQCRQITGTTGHVGEFFTGAEGSCFGGGKVFSKNGITVPDIKLDTDDSMVQEHVDLIRSAFSGQPLNDARRIAETTLTVIMGRISAYTGELVRFADLLTNENSAHYNFKFTPSPKDFETGNVKLPAEVPPIPGKA